MLYYDIKKAHYLSDDYFWIVIIPTNYTMKAPPIYSFQKHTFLLLSFFYIFFSPKVCAQVPQGIPKDMGPVDFSSTSNIIIYIVLPVVVLIAFFFWRSAVKRRKREDEDKI